jgi:Flp pilus assembly protein TadG
MSRASSNRRRSVLGSAGTTSMEFALIAIPFFFITFATMDLGRYFITQHSLGTLTSELARATLIYCTGKSPNSVCTLPAAGTPSVQTAKAAVPFLAGAFASGPTASRSVVNTNTGEMTITASASYNFNFFMPLWTGLDGNLSSTTNLRF